MRRWKHGRSVALILFFYLGIALITTWPLATLMADHLPGATRDALLHYWNAWWVREAFQTGHSPFFSPYLFHPDGVSLVYHNLPWFTILPWLPLQAVMDDIVAYNVVFLVNLALCGAAAFWLAFRLTGSRLAALLAGLIYQAWPFRLSQLDHPNLVTTYWIPLFFLALLNLLQRPARHRALLAGLLLALVGYTRWQHLIPVALMTFVFVVVLNLTKPQFRSPRHWAMLLLAGATAALLLLPPLLLLVQEQVETEATAGDLLREGEEQVMQTDLLAYITPAREHFLLGTRTTAMHERYYRERIPDRRFPAYVGLVALSLAFLGFLLRRRDSLPWLALALLLVGLALGHVLRVGGQLYPSAPTLFRLLEPLFVVRLIRVPDRFNLFLALPVVIMAALGASEILARLKRRPRLLATAGLIALILLEYLTIPIATRPTALSPFYRQIEGGEALLNLPIDPFKSKVYMFAQTVHEQPILHGHVSRLPPGAYSFIDSNPWLRGLRERSEMPPWLTDVSRQLALLRDVGVAHLIFHKDLAGDDRIAHWQRYLSLTPRFEDDSVIVYSTAPRAGQDFTLLTELQPGIGPITTRVALRCVRPGEPLIVDVAWAATDAPRAPFQARLDLQRNGQRVRQDTFPLAAGWPSQEWPADAIVWDYYTLPLSGTLPAGVYDLQLSLDGPDPASRSLRLGQVQVAQDCLTNLPPEATSLDARFGQELRLLGYAYQREADRLQLTLYWQSLQHIGQDYKIFVHVFDPATGVPVAQDDAMPLQGGYPTRFWGAGETVVDHISVDLQAAPAGAYGLAVGVYHPDSLERLPLQVTGGTLIPDGRLVIPGRTVEIVR